MKTLAPLPGPAALDAYFLEARAKLLDLAAILDRVSRGGNTNGVEDARLGKIRRALEVLGGPQEGRAEKIQQLFSLDYDPDWQPPTPR